MYSAETKNRLMSEALREALKAFDEDEVPVGAVVVFKEKIIGKGHNQIEKLKDATAHAEMIAITAASNNFNNWRLTDCDIFVTVEPCLMCTGAIISSRIRHIYFGAFDPKFGACGSIYNPAQEGKLNHKVKITSGLLTAECEAIMKDFFKQKRSNYKKKEF